MGDHKDPADDAKVRVNIRPSSDPIEEWENEFGDGAGPATTIDPDALKKLRLEESAPDLSDLVSPAEPAEDSESGEASAKSSPAKGGPFESVSDSAENEFDDRSMTVMDSRSIAEREASGESSVPVGEPCPKCGVQVAPGYPKCPRCKAVLIQNNQAHKKVSGGTSVTGRTVPWTIVVIAALLTAVIYYLAEREPRLDGAGDDIDTESQEADTASSAGDDEPRAETSTENAEEQDDEAADE